MADLAPRPEPWLSACWGAVLLGRNGVEHQPVRRLLDRLLDRGCRRRAAERVVHRARDNPLCCPSPTTSCSAASRIASASSTTTPPRRAREIYCPRSSASSDTRSLGARRHPRRRRPAADRDCRALAEVAPRHRPRRADRRARPTPRSTRLFGLVRARRAAGTSFIYISHRLDEIAALCDRVAVLRDGELVGSRADAPTDAIVAMMTGKELGDVHARRARARRSALRARGPAPPRGAPDPARPRASSTTCRSPSAPARSSRSRARWARAAPRRSRRCSASRAAPVTGTFRVDGRGSRCARRADAIAAGLALVPEDRKAQGLVLGLSVADNLALSVARPHVAASASSTVARVEQPRCHVSAISRSRCRVSAPRSRRSPAAISRRS